MYSLEYIEDFFRAENDADGCGSFTAVERSMSDRLLAQKEIVGGIHGECTMQSLRDKHAWCITHDVAVGIVGRYDVRTIKRPAARAHLGLVPPIPIE